MAQLRYFGLSYLQMKWHIFRYNFSWSKYVGLLDGWPANLAIGVPFIGYLILFNDSVSQHLTFQNLSKAPPDSFHLSASARLQFLYFGLISLGAANVFYRLRRPYVLRIGRSRFEYVERALQHFTVSNYIEINDTIKHSDFDPFTMYGKYSESEFKEFLHEAEGDNSTVRRNWASAKAKYEELLRSILIENYFRNDITRRPALVVCIVLGSIGYGLILVPSVDLFVRVLQVTILG